MREDGGDGAGRVSGSFARDLARLRNVSGRRNSCQDDSRGRSPWESSARAAAATFLAATVRFCCTFAPRTAAREPRARLTVVMEAMATGPAVRWVMVTGASGDALFATNECQRGRAR